MTHLASGKNTIIHLPEPFFEWSFVNSSQGHFKLFDYWNLLQEAHSFDLIGKHLLSILGDCLLQLKLNM